MEHPPISSRDEGRPSTIPHRPQEAAPARKTILLIDDNEAFREIASAWISDRYDVVHAADALTGLAAAERRRPDLILLDIMMPKISGIDFLQALKMHERLNGTPIVLVTGYPVSHDDGMASALRPWRVLEKPFPRATLLASIEAVLGSS